MPVFILHQETCKQCGICSRVCPATVLKGREGEHPVMRPGGSERCIACGHCTAFCPHRACDIDVLPADQYRSIDRSLLPSAEAVDMLCKTRRSTRAYKPEPVPRELLAELLDTVRYSPSAKNQQALRFICAGRETLQALGDTMAEWLDTPAGLQRIAEGKGLVMAWRQGLDPLFRGAPHAIFVLGPKNDHWSAIDAAVAATYLELAAHPRKLGCCWAGYVVGALAQHAPMREILGIGPDEAVHAAQMLGFMALRPMGIPARKPLACNWMS